MMVAAGTARKSINDVIPERKKDDMSLCPEWKLRERMSEAEFWEYVFGCGPDVDDDEEWDVQVVADLTPCPECGENGPCSYDLDGRPLIHLVGADDT
jgi:hypothetical protein